jgi:uncharacterized membrane protein YfcA
MSFFADLGLDPLSLAIVMLAFVAGGFVKGVLGFGLPLTTLAIIPFVAPIGVGLATNAIVAFLANMSQFMEGGLGRATLRRFWPVLVALVPGVAIGAAALTAVDEDALLLTLGLTVIGFVALNASGLRLATPPHRETAVGATAGFVAGVIGALTTSNGPIFLMFLIGLGLERTAFRSALGLLFIASGALTAIGYVAIGVIDVPRAALGVACIAPTALGVWLGRKVGDRIDQTLFRRLVLGGLITVGVSFVLKGSGAL